jgi:protein-S-isoprenylcysteine O-methyltransferase Ste14
MRLITSETLAALISTLAFIFLLLPIFYIWIPYEIISSRYMYSFDIGILRYSGLCFVVFGIVIGILCSIVFVVQGKGSPIPFSPTKELVVTGIYRYVRNPLYLAGSSMCCACRRNHTVSIFWYPNLFLYYVWNFLHSSPYGGNAFRK